MKSIQYYLEIMLDAAEHATCGSNADGYASDCFLADHVSHSFKCAVSKVNLLGFYVYYEGYGQYRLIWSEN